MDRNSHDQCSHLCSRSHGGEEGQPLIKGGVPLFEWRPNASVEDFLEEDVESADEYEHFSEDIFDPTEPDHDVVKDNDYD